MLDITFAEFNIEQAVICKACENTNHSTHLIPQGGQVFSCLPYKNILFSGREIVKSRSKGFGQQEIKTKGQI